ncbi:hypothetical protein [Novosphingobium terrae]|uniref:hypothetical protein n=1 Tax=Novosphingobium terrae TaxID=2726189 RepID=UPI00197CC1A5|nr:hypothetical protein [Novosphingobium terrae]
MQVSFVALIAAAPSQSWAQCSPDPSQANNAITCSGSDTNGYTITTSASPLTVNSDASVTNNGAAAIGVSIPASGPYSPRYATITVNGTVSANGAAGISVQAGSLGTSSYDYYGTTASILVGATGSVSGTYGITAAQTAGNSYGAASVSLVNAGTISGSSGVALYTSGNSASFSSITNQATGKIGAIQANSSITNAGTIDGGSLSAIAPGGGTAVYYGSITNSGTITSTSSAGTIANYVYVTNSGTITNTGSGMAVNSPALNITNLAGGTISASGSAVLGGGTSTAALTNSGTIANTGTGAVIAVSGNGLAVTNNAGGVISTAAGNTVLSTTAGLNLVNKGSIVGNVMAGNGVSTIDSSSGTITGNLILGSANDTLIATLKNGSLYTGISGSIDGGGGTNAVVVKTSTDATLSSAVALPTNFSVLDLAPAGNTTLTLASTYPVLSTILFDGTGTLDNQATIRGSGQILGQLNGYAAGGTFKNSGSITSATSGTTAAVSMVSGSINNIGSISATGNAVVLSGGNTFTNSGTISAGGTAASVYVGSNFTNSGTISSTGGTGLSLMFSCTCGTGSNSGVISGASLGLNLIDGTLANTGTISASNTAVTLGSYARIDNQAGGVISGGAAAITVAYGNYFSNVHNAGTINGSVNITNSNWSSLSIGNTYYASAGSVLNGNLVLGNGDQLVTPLTGSGTSGYAGINGTVYGNNSILRYDVTADASSTLTTHAGFGTTIYQVASGTTLTLGTNGSSGSAVTLAGNGNVVLNGTVNTTNQAALTSTAVLNSDFTSANSILTVTNNGTLASTRSSSSGTTGTVLLPSSYSSTGYTGSTFINNGTVSFTDTTGGSSTYAAVSSVTVANNGTINATGGTAVSATTLNNTGSITSNGVAVSTSNSTTTNSGTITSTAGAAIRSAVIYGGGDTLINLAGGTINGVGAAVQMSNALVSNAGTINGNVDLSYSPSGGTGYITSAYIANGGTLNGNLTFGSGNDILIETGAGFGVTGTIDGGAGTNWVGHQRSGTATVTLGSTLPNTFSGEFSVAAGSASQVTLTGPSAYAGNIYVGGDGTIINQLATTGTVYGLNASGISYAPYLKTELASFVNRANVGGVSLNTTSFDNSAIIGSASLTGTALSVGTAGSMVFNNSGTIINNGNTPAASLSVTTGNSTVTNSGTITGGLIATANYFSVTNTANPVTLDLINSGTITGKATTGSYNNYGLTAYGYNVARLSLNNSGTITNGVNAYVTNNSPGGASFDVVNSGTISGQPYGSLVGTAIYATGYNLGRLSVTNSGTINGGISLSGGDVTVINNGTINGDISTGTGNATIAMNGAFSGSIYAGTGFYVGTQVNTLSINGGSQSAPVAFKSIYGINTLTQTGGFATVSGAATFDSATLTGGRLVGLAGSVLSAANFTVGSNATFGSAGTVKGNVTVSGTLSPGASPGTMTVNGNVTLNSGSTSLFEITPTVSDKLVVNGKMTIQSGSTLQIAASSPVKVGSTLDLISATGGVSGTYDTVTGMAGSVRALANGDLGLLVQFANPGNYTPQVRNAIAYLNNAMAASSAPTALFPALSSLQDSNAAPIASAFAQLTPEPYADAMQIGTETALSLSSAARSLGEGETSGATHLFGFGQMLGSLRQFASNEEQGVSHASINGFGVLGGLGVAGADYAFSAYVGWVDQMQSIAALGASTKARGVVGGVAARFGGATRLTLAVNYDNAHALTRRYVPDAGTISTSYALPSWSFDASISHAVPLGDGWVVRPQIGTTWVRTSHDAIAEVSAHPFALNVQAADMTQGFIDAGLGFETAPDAKGPWRRFLTLGARYRAQGDGTMATAALAGYSPTLTALGVGRNRLDATIAAGVEYRLAPGASLFFNASGELGKAGKRESATAGLRFRL